MHADRLEVNVSFDPRQGYIASAPELETPVTALSLHGLRRRLEAMLPDEPHVLFILDGAAERERHRRRAAPPPARAR
jgi:hypothetical protein